MGLAANQQTSQNQHQTPGPQQLTAYQILGRYLLNSLGQGADSFSAYRARGGARQYPQTPISAGEAAQLDPNAVDPQILAMTKIFDPNGRRTTNQPGAGQNNDASTNYLVHVPTAQGGTGGGQQNQLMQMLGGLFGSGGGAQQQVPGPSWLQGYVR